MDILNSLLIGGIAAAGVYGLVCLLSAACDLNETIEERAEREVLEKMDD